VISLAKRRLHALDQVVVDFSPFHALHLHIDQLLLNFLTVIFGFLTSVLIFINDADSQILSDILAYQFFNQQVFVFYRVKFFVENLAEHSEVVYRLENFLQWHTDGVRHFWIFLVGQCEVKAVIRLVELYLHFADANSINKTNDVFADLIEKSLLEIFDPVLLL